MNDTMPSVKIRFTNVSKQLFRVIQMIHGRAAGFFYLLILTGILLITVPVAQAQDDLRRIPDPDPELQLEMLHAAEGFEVNLFAAEPMVVKPIQMNWDAEGRLWVAGSTVYPQLKPGERPNDKIYVLEDTNGDGVADRSTVFADGLLMPTGILPGDGGVYVANSTEIIHLKDTTGDGKADQSRVVLSGFGTADSHHLIHTFRWGPDGKLYFNQSIYIFSHVETPWGVRRLEGGGVWHLRPETLELEVYARGLVNPWGLQFDRWGQSFLTDGAGGEGINYAFPGATFTAAPGAERILRGLNPGQPKHSGLEVVSGRHLPEEWEGSFIANDYRANRINRFVLDEQGFGFSSEQAEDILWTDHIAFRPVDVSIGPDGAIYVADWYNPIIQHGEVDFRDERRDQQRGRIWRITARDRPLVTPPNLAEADIRDLLDALKLPENWTRAQARQLLKERGFDVVIPEINKWLNDLDIDDSGYENHLLEALWVFRALDVPDESLVQKLLDANDHRVRAAAVRSLYYWHDRFNDILSLLGEAVRDDHPHVRREAVIALRKQASAEAARDALTVLESNMDEFIDFALWQTIRELEPYWMARMEEDPGYIMDPKSKAYALKSVSNPDAVKYLVQLYREGKVPKDYHNDVLNSVARWGGTEELNILYNLAMGDEFIHQNGRVAYLRALEEASQQQGKRPALDLKRVSRFIYSDDEAVALSAIRLIGYWEVKELRGQLLQLARGNNENIQKASLDALAAIGDEESQQLLTGMTEAGNPDGLRLLAAARLVSFDIPEAAATAVNVLQDIEDQADPVDLFSAFLQRTEGTRALADELKERRIPEELARAGRQAMQRHLPWYRQNDHDSQALKEALEASGGTLPPERMPQDLSSQQINNLEREVRATADPVRGERIFRQPSLMCMNCHAIGSAGGQSGPDLSSLGTSAPTDNIIRALVDPNRSVKEGYELTRVVRTDGSEVMGTLVRETSSEVVLRNAADQEVSIPASQVDIHEIVSGSLMPPGLTAQLEREEFIDLVGFLSQLGEPGEFRVPNTRLVRRWRTLNNNETATSLIRDNGPAHVVREEGRLQWLNAYSMVSGDLPLDELPVIEPDQDRRYSFVRFEVEVLGSGNIAFALNFLEGITLWAGGELLDSEGQGQGYTIYLQEGVHQISVAIDRDDFEEGHLRIWLEDAENNPAQARLVIGK